MLIHFLMGNSMGRLPVMFCHLWPLLFCMEILLTHIFFTTGQAVLFLCYFVWQILFCICRSVKM